MGEVKILLSGGLDRMSFLREIPLEDSSSSCHGFTCGGSTYSLFASSPN
jgi:hypothetical protein